ncbi:MAG: hypothetical protein C0596_06375 [Marinilabiliales bacterium]|nr:MAG: hypothetical protein C0596_06375 [Marinilabiliales bacterium]
MAEDGVVLIINGDITIKNNLNEIQINGEIKIDLDNLDSITKSKILGSGALSISGLLIEKGLKEEIEDKIKIKPEIYPKQVTDHINIICANCEANTFEIAILSTNEEIIHKETFNLLQKQIKIIMPLDELPIGAYVLKVKVKDTCITNKFVKIG